jgi:type II pantothenate kinase
MRPFCKLRDPSTYVACDWDLTQDDAGRAHWVAFFKRHLDTILELGIAAAVVRGESAGSAAARANACREEFCDGFDAFAANPSAFRAKHGPITIVTLDRWRDGYLRQHGFGDAFVDLKNRENERALPLLPQVCRQLDTLSGIEQLQAIVEGIFAGNIFDMGAEATAKAFLAGGPDFFATRQRLAKRPWLIDDFDALAQRMLKGKPHRKVVFFIDNAGSDVLLGALPMMRWLAKRGSKVVLAANERPTLNDMTIHDVDAWWRRICEAERSFGDLPIERVSTGTGEPLIDLMEVSDELNQAAADADLVILEGMGRGVESNLNADFTCERLNVAMLKDEAVAKRVGGDVFDVVCRYQTL